MIFLCCIIFKTDIKTLRSIATHHFKKPAKTN